MRRLLLALPAALLLFCCSAYAETGGKDASPHTAGGRVLQSMVCYAPLNHTLTDSLTHWFTHSLTPEERKDNAFLNAILQFFFFFADGECSWRRLQTRG